MKKNLSFLEELETKGTFSTISNVSIIKKMNIWLPDKALYTEIQKLTQFLDFVASIEGCASNETIEKVKFQIQHIDKPETWKDWYITLKISEDSFQDLPEEGVYLRKWSVDFDNQHLSVEAETNHTLDDCGHYGDDFCYYMNVYFGTVIGEQRVFVNESLDSFIADAKKYKQYISGFLTEVDTDIQIWD